MWFLFVAAGLVLVVLCGLYARRRIAGALTELGVRGRRVRIVRWILAWLLFAYPLLVIGAIVLSRLLGAQTLPRFDGYLASMMLGVPFVLSVLVVLQAVPWLVALDVASLVVRRRRGAATASRMRALGVLVAIGSFGLYTPLRILAERGDVRVRHHELAAATATAASTPFRIAFLADVQQDVHTDATRARELYALVNATHPDVVLSGGDWINTGPDYIASAAAAAGTLHSRLGTFSVLGDHEHFAYVDRDRSVREVEQAMRGQGVTMVSDEVRWFEHDGKRIAVLFINHNYIHRAAPATIVRLLASMTGADYSIAVTHQLDGGLAALLEDKVDLVLAGHTHGGQVNPVVGLTHVSLARLETRFVDGRYSLGKTTVIVTAGIGTSIVPIRYASPGSMEVVELRL
jgi:predicted MPP superfamily phosphohydrolase